MKIFRYLMLLAVAVSCSGNADPEGNPGGESQENNEKKEELSSGYARKMVAMQFTSIGCTNCPLLSTAIKNIQSDMPGVIVPVAFHMDYEISDPMTLQINRKFYEKVDDVKDGSIGLPKFALDFRTGSQHIVNEYAKISSEIKLQSETYPAVCAVAIKTDYDDSARSLLVKAAFKSDVAEPYRYHIFLVEDGFEYSQMGADTETYVHDNVLRYVASDDVRGSRLNSGSPLEAGKEYVIEKTVAVDSKWNASKMRVVVAMLKEDGGEWGSNNANVCAVGDSADYSFSK